MKLFFWRRKPQPEVPPAPLAPAPTTARSATATGVLERSQLPTRPLAMPIELRDALLRFALDCLVASGARVRVEADDLIAAVLPGGATVRYTTSLTRARAEEETELLVQGGSALARLLEECAAHAALTALRLDARAGGREIAATQLPALPATCGACAHDTAVELCQRCPLRTNALALAGIAERTPPRIARQEMVWSVELSYAVVANDRQGRRDERQRLAFGSRTGMRLPLLSADMLAEAQAHRLPASAESDLEATRSRAEGALLPELEATAALLRLLSEREYRARLDDIHTTSKRLQRETPERAREIVAALDAEVARLGEVYAVEVEARLASVCFVERPIATIAVAIRSGATVELLADLAAGALLPPACASCQRETRAATICAAGHVVCPACWQRHTEQSETGCPACAGTSAPEAPEEGTSFATADGALSLAHLDAMSEATWRRFVTWLLEQEGLRVARAPAVGALDLWTCEPAQGDGAPALAGAVRYEDSRALAADEVTHLAAQSAGAPDGHAPAHLLITTATAGPAARDAAQRLGVRLLDRTALSLRLEALVAHHLHERDTARHTLEHAAESATATRAALLDALQRAEEALAAATNARRAAGRSAVTTASRTLREALLASQRALLAEETLIHDWEASFSEREARDGSLAIVVDAAAFGEMAARAGHLGDALRGALEAAAATPGVGDLGYTVWRRDVLDALSAQCEEYRWRVLSVDPAHWRDFAAAHDTQAYERAGSAATTAARATERIVRSYEELARRAHLETAAE